LAVTREGWENGANITLLLAEAKLGNQEALARLTPLVYAELRRLAGHYMRNERPGHTLQGTALVHEAWLRLAGQKQMEWQSRAHFLGVAAQSMRRILVDYARQRVTAKRGGEVVKVDEERFNAGAGMERPEDVMAVDEALERLAAFDAQQCRVVEMRYFAGMTVEETAEALGLSPRTVKREWAMAKAWLSAELSGEGRR